MAKSKHPVNLAKTCEDCVHETACRVWTSGRPLSPENAAKCPSFETVRDTAAYLIGKMEANQKTNRDWLDSLSAVELVNWIKNTAAGMSDAELLKWMEADRSGGDV